MEDKLSKKWGLMVSKIRKLEKLRREIEESEKIDLDKCEDTIIEGLDGRITQNLLEIESFLREVIREGKR